VGLNCKSAEIFSMGYWKDSSWSDSRVKLWKPQRTNRDEQKWKQL